MSKNKILAIAAPVKIEAAKAESGELPKFETTVYNGGPLTLTGWDQPVVVDLSALRFSQTLIANLDHDSSKEVGHVTSKQVTDNQIILGGEISRVNDSSRELIASSTFPWQASIEAQPLQVTELQAGDKQTVNGSEVEGPAYVVAAELEGFAFLSRGADRNTEVSIAASANTPKEKKVDSKLEAWVREIGFDPDNVTEDQLASIQANYQGKPTPPTDRGFDQLKAHAKRRKEIYAIAKRQCEHAMPEEVEAIQELADQAIKAGDSVSDFKLQLLEAREGLPVGQVIHAPKRDGTLNDRIVEAAVCQAGGLESLDKVFRPQELQAAEDKFRGQIGLKQLFFLCAENAGYNRGYQRDVSRDVLLAAFHSQSQIRANAAYSTLNIPTILSNVANKFLVEAFNFVESAWSSISRTRAVSDFKEVTTVRPSTNSKFRKLGAGGTIEHGTTGELTYSNKADTFARMMGITRQDLINDDLGALTDIPRELGRGAAQNLNDIFWAEFLDNAAFFAAGNKNLVTTTPLDEAGLNAATVAFKKQTDAEDEPLGAMPRILLVPIELEDTALRLMNSELVVGSTDRTNINTWRNRYQVVSSLYLSDARFTGNSVEDWYLLASPRDLTTMEVAALNGNVAPTVETADADFNTLGVQMRGYNDVGVRKQEYRAGVKADAS